DSPGADELGRSGLSGWVETHFWKRYGGALMLSIVDDTAEYLVQKQRSQGGDSITFSGAGDATSQAASIALQNSINIPPTLNKNQGDIVNIYVARDLDFRSVYDLRSN
ncbi:TrbI/VirB10 family protein, partial [Mesorhizobium sp. M7A.T.Ca.US.000.02.2.1]|uniref:TrbI/VirB10 family protein n=1 Tax=Mesorhizobium sp. M7A.T.Ca.US.000.02.2.1 TaxID=2496793 RepID=UPI000FD1DC1B